MKFRQNSRYGGSMSWIFYVFAPMLFHLVISEMTAILAGNVLDSAARTALSAFLVLPLAFWMYRQDKKRSISPGGIRHMDTAAKGDSDRSGGTQRKTGQQRMNVFAAAVLCLLGGGLLNVLWSRILNLLQISSYFSNETQEALLASGIWMQLFGPGLLVPAAEELIFRGLVYTRMRTRLSMWQAIILSALLFALYHGNPIQMIYAFPMALILALIYEKSGCMAYPILFHMGANLTAIFFA